MENINKNSNRRDFLKQIQLAPFGLVAVLLLSGCKKETKKECYNRGKRDGIKEGYKSGWWAGYRAFVKDSWKPTLAGITIGAFGMVLIAGFYFFLVRPSIRKMLLKSRINKLIASAEKMELVAPHHKQLSNDLYEVKRLNDQVFEHLNKKLRAKIQLQDEKNRLQMRSEVYRIQKEILSMKSKTLIVQSDIQNLSNIFKTNLNEDFANNLNEINNDKEIGTEDKAKLITKTQNIFFTDKI